ncbi:hypothetical protein BJX63DRAFT_50250 [Aspergillus granulosus]|uniref:Uncharacterized protein n=1 Tax=Aspergillus granulosus TaxID=176169 RepID=A0ABR4GY62_9EURO
MRESYLGIELSHPEDPKLGLRCGPSRPARARLALSQDSRIAANPDADHVAEPDFVKNAQHSPKISILTHLPNFLSESWYLLSGSCPPHRLSLVSLYFSPGPPAPAPANTPIPRCWIHSTQIRTPRDLLLVSVDGARVWFSISYADYSILHLVAAAPGHGGVVDSCLVNISRKVGSGAPGGDASRCQIRRVPWPPHCSLAVPSLDDIRHRFLDDSIAKPSCLDC